MDTGFYNIHLEIEGLVTLTKAWSVVKCEELKQINRHWKRVRMQYYDKKAVGVRLKEMRQIQGLTQCELSEKLDYTSE